MPEATKIRGVLTYGEGLPAINTHDHSNTLLYGVTWKIENIKISLTTFRIVIKHARVMPYCEKLSPSK